MRAPKSFLIVAGCLFLLIAAVGAYADNATRFQDNGDGTVTDHLTGLMWQQADDGEKRKWSWAKAYCRDLELGGYDDWYLPSIAELVSIMDYSKVDMSLTEPAIDPVFDCSPGAFWTGTVYAPYPKGQAWYMNFVDGLLKRDYKKYPHCVRCVRQAQ